MSRMLVCVVVLGLVGCPSAAPKPGTASSSAADMSPPAPAQGQPGPWWCIAFNEDQNGFCQKVRARCVEALWLLFASGLRRTRT